MPKYTEFAALPVGVFTVYFHSRKKIFGHMFVHYAGPTLGPASWSGEGAQKLTGDVWEHNMVNRISARQKNGLWFKKKEWQC